MEVAITAGVLMTIVLVVMFVRIGKAKAKRQAFLEGYEFPSTIRSGVKEVYPHLEDDDLRKVEEGLRTYLRLCQNAGNRSLAMPSRAVDEAWHQFILVTAAYEAFCNEALGHFLHHTPAEYMGGDVQDAVKRVWRLSCEAEELDPLKPSHLPQLFVLDETLKLADGLRYTTVANGGETFDVNKIGCGGGCANQPVYDVT